jgi:hypothetical protein
MVLGCRRFTGSVPPRSRIGNTVTRALFRSVTGLNLTDTPVVEVEIATVYLRHNASAHFRLPGAADNHLSGSHPGGKTTSAGCGRSAPTAIRLRRWVGRRPHASTSRCWKYECTSIWLTAGTTVDSLFRQRRRGHYAR